MRFIDTLAARQVDQIQLGDLDLGRSLLGLALDVDAEDGVTATGGLVEAGLCDVAHLVALFHQLHHLLSVAYSLLCEFVDVDALDALADVEVLVRSIDQVVDILVVNLRKVQVEPHIFPKNTSDENLPPYS